MLTAPLNPDKKLKRGKISPFTAHYSLEEIMKNVNRAERGASDADREDREYRGVGRKATVRRKVEARQAARRVNKAILFNDSQEA